MYRRYGVDENSTQGCGAERDSFWREPDGGGRILSGELWNRPRSSA